MMVSGIKRFIVLLERLFKVVKHKRRNIVTETICGP